MSTLQEVKTHPCPECGQATPDIARLQKKKYCSRRCKQYASAHRRYITNEEYRLSVKTNSANAKKRAISNGVCRDCYQEKAKVGGTHCVGCLEKKKIAKIIRSPK